jgi:nucleotide-binding universal stress UspA family protein
MMKKILVPIDGSGYAFKAIEMAADMAKLYKASVSILHVYKHAEVTGSMLDYMKSEKIKESPTVTYESFIENQITGPAFSKLRNMGIDNVEAIVLRGDPAEVIIEYAKERGIDTIIMGARGTGSIKGFMMGSVSTKVCQGTDRTCIVVRKSLLDGKKILIVDDEPDILESLAELLPMCDVVTTTSFEKAKELLETQAFDLAILDIMGVDGYGLLKIANEKKVTAVMLTSHALSPGNVVESYEKGAASYVPKDEMSNITTYLNDVLEAKEKGVNLWGRWLDRLGSFFTRRFGPDWQDEHRSFWERFPTYMGGP